MPLFLGRRTRAERPKGGFLLKRTSEMPVAELMTRLLEIERRAGSHDEGEIRTLATAAQDDLLALERAMISVLAANENLNRRLEKRERAQTGQMFLIRHS